MEHVQLLLSRLQSNSIAIKHNCNQTQLHSNQLQSNQLQSVTIAISIQLQSNLIAIKINCNQDSIAIKTQLQSRLDCNQDSIAIKYLFEFVSYINYIAINNKHT